MTHIVLSTSGAPSAIGPYSQGIHSGSAVYLSGQLGLDPASGTLRDGITAQTEQAITNIEAVLGQARMTLAHVVKTTVFLKNMEDFTAMNTVYAKMFREPFPARSTVEVARLPKEALVEIEVIAQNHEIRIMDDTLPR